MTISTVPFGPKAQLTSSSSRGTTRGIKRHRDVIFGSEALPPIIANLLEQFHLFCYVSAISYYHFLILFPTPLPVQSALVVHTLPGSTFIMAQTLQSNTPARISQLLPTVKCSNCNALVPMTDLGEHICAPAPPVPKPPLSPSSLLPARLQGFVSRRSQTPKARESNVPERRATPSIKAPPPARLNSPGPMAPSPFVQPNSAQLSPAWNQNRVPSPLSGPDRGGPSLSLQERLRTTSDSRMEPPRPFAERERTLSTGRREPYSPQPPPSPILRTRTPSSDSRGSSTPLRPSFDLRQSNDSRTPSRPTLDSRPPNDMRGPGTPLRPSFDHRPPNDSRAPNTPSRPSFDSRPSLDVRAPGTPLRPSFDSRPSFDHRPPPDARPSIDSVRVPPRQGSYTVEAGPPPSSPPSQAAPAPPRSPAPKAEPDTKVGGDAGMAGVGRRGFAAAARAAMFAVPGHAGGPRHDRDMQAGDGRRANAPKYLDINTSSSYCEFLCSW